MSRELFLNNVRAAFSSGEVKVDKSIFLVEHKGKFYGCAVGAGQYKTGKSRRPGESFTEQTATQYNLSKEYMSGVSVGFSSQYFASNASMSSEFRQGFDDGKALWEEFKHLNGPLHEVVNQ
jgi:hypothetical protein